MRKTPEKAPRTAPAKRSEAPAPQKATAPVTAPSVEPVASTPSPAPKRSEEKATRSMTIWLTPSQLQELDSQVVRIQAGCPAAKVTRSSYATHALLTQIAADRAGEPAKG